MGFVIYISCIISGILGAKTAAVMKSSFGKNITVHIFHKMNIC